MLRYLQMNLTMMGFVQNNGGRAVSENTNVGRDRMKSPTTQSRSKSEDGNGSTLYFSLKLCIGNCVILFHAKYNTKKIFKGHRQFGGVIKCR